MSSAQIVWTVVALVVVVAVVVPLLRVWQGVRVSQELVAAAEPYRQQPDESDFRVLVLGDSTAVGVGADRPEDSVAGRLGVDILEARIDNLSKSGLRSAGLLKQLDEVDGEYDLIVVHIGANDVLRMENLEETKANIDAIVDWAQARSVTVAWFSSGDIGESRLLPWYARSLMSRRSLQLRDYGVELAKQREGLVYVDLYYQEPGVEQAEFYARDNLHLSSTGYRLWYEQLRATLIETGNAEVVRRFK